MPRPIVRWGWALLGAAAFFVSVRSVDQAWLTASVALALVGVWPWGRAAGRVLLGVSRLPPCTAVYLGQFALLAAAVPVTALHHVVAATSGHRVPLALLVVPANAAMLAYEVYRSRHEPRSVGAPEPPIGPLALMALGSVGVVTAIYAGHLSALGLDTHEHMAWVQQILTHGYVPIAEPGTAIVSEYPRSFHLLTALYAAAGLAAPVGPITKTMPFLQSALPAVALAELVVEAMTRQTPGRRWRWEIAGGLAFYVFAFLLVPMAYPNLDLSGTPRISSNGVLLLPIALVLLAHAFEAPRAAWAAVASLPLVCAWALTFNPVLPVLVATATCPMLASWWAVLRPARDRAVPWARVAAAVTASTALAVLVVALDPWAMSMAADRSPRLASQLRRAGVITFREAVEEGRASPRQKLVREVPPAPPCRDVRCLARAVEAAAAHAVLLPVRMLDSAARDSLALVRAPSLRVTRTALQGAIPIQPASLADHAGLPWVLLVAAGAIVAARTARRAEPSPPVTRRLLFGSIVGLVAAGVLLDFAAGLAAALNDQGHEGTLLALYLAAAGVHLNLGFLWLPFVTGAMVIAHSLLRQRVDGVNAAWWSRRRKVVVLAAAVWIALPPLARLNLDKATRARTFFGPIGRADLDALRRIERMVPSEAGVLVPAEHWNIADFEHWVIPVGDTTALLPYGDRRYLFNVYLGASYPLSWRDLTDELCSPDRSRRARFLERAGARFLLVRDAAGASAAEVVRRQRLCDEPIAALGLEPDPVASDSGIHLFRLRR